MERTLRVASLLLMLLGAAMLIAGSNSVIPFGAIASGAALLTVLESRKRRQA